MKKVIVAALLVVGMTAFAQEKDGKKDGREKLTPEQKVDFQVKKLTTDLNLNEKQVKEVRNLVAKQVEKREAKIAEMRAKKEEKAQKGEEIRANLQKDQAANNEEMQKILTPEQFAKWEKIREERKENFKEKMAERREKRDLKEPQESK